MKIAIFGHSGQVASELRRRAPRSAELTVFGRDAADFLHPAHVEDALRDNTFDAVINAAAYTAVDRAEDEPEIARRVNAETVGVLARVLAKTGTPLVHISTDYVFDGSGHRPWRPYDTKAPINTYGTTKRAGEEAIAASGVPYTILRTSWVFSAFGTNFVKTMLRLGAERNHLTIVGDQIGGPTAAHAIADTVFSIVWEMHGGAPGGTHHFSGTDDTSWADFAREIFAQSRTTCSIEDIPTSAYPTPASRPLNSRLDCESLKAAFGISRPEWRRDLALVLKELT